MFGIIPSISHIRSPIASLIQPTGGRICPASEPRVSRLISPPASSTIPNLFCAAAEPCSLQLSVLLTSSPRRPPFLS
ncbi:hypothetical protein TgHK011_007048 [Trichoderma gracile]|nr:hypothetical protein TgHK011_007048 [Trichoderma gracile]